MNIKPIGNVTDINKVLELFTKVFYESPYNEKWNKGDAIKRLNDLHKRAKDFCFYAEEKGEVIGLLFCSLLIWADGIHVFVEDIAVAPKYRRKGVGKKLVQKLEEVAKQKKIVAIDMEVQEDSLGLPFWKKMGYEIPEVPIIPLKKKL